MPVRRHEDAGDVLHGQPGDALVVHHLGDEHHELAVDRGHPLEEPAEVESPEEPVYQTTDWPVDRGGGELSGQVDDPGIGGEAEAGAVAGVKGK